MRNVILIIALLGVCTLAESNFLGAQDKTMHDLKSIESTAFGKNLLDTIALQLHSSNSPMKNIAKLINQMINDLRAQQVKSDVEKASKDSECKDKKAEFQGRINVAQRHINEATSALVSNKKKRRTLNQEITTGKAQLVSIRTQRKDAKANRKEDYADFLERQEATKIVIDALKVIIPKMKNIDPSAATKAPVDQVILAELAKIGNNNPIKALVQIATRLDPKALERAIVLLERLSKDFEKWLTDDLSAEVEAKVRFDKLIIGLAAQEKIVSAELVKDQAEIAEVIATIKREKARLATNSEEHKDASADLKAKTNECRLYVERYERETK
jgi:septal ring factor EnvC (AmiA/AmiB activator)